MSTQNAEIPATVQTNGDPKQQPGSPLPQDLHPTNNGTAQQKRRDFFNALSEIQAELEDLQNILSSIRKGKTIIPTYAEYIAKTKKDLQELMGFINHTELPKEVENNQHIIRHINNDWEQLKVSPLIEDPNANIGDLQRQLHFLDLLDEQIHSFNYQISQLSIPHQINERLDRTGPGYFIPFHEVFASDVPSSDDRDRLLRYIALSPGLIQGGFVDIESGRIYRYSTSRRRRILSMVMVIVALGIATGIVAAATLLPKDMTGWDPLKLPAMLVAWAAVLIGVGVHILVGSAKRSKTQNGLPSVLMDLILIIDARFGEIVMKLILSLVGLFGLVIISNMPQAATQVSPLNAFLVGYSLDSIIELFGTSMEGASQLRSIIK